MNHGEQHRHSQASTDLPHHAHGHAHGHALDQGVSGFLRYARMLPRMWRSEVSTAVVARVAPKPYETVLEIGSGMGAAAVVAARSGAKVFAIDPTPYMRKILNARRLMERNGRKIAVLEGAAEAIPVTAESIDAVWSVNTMHHWASVERALHEIHRILRPGGRLLLVDEDFDDPGHPSFQEFQRRRAKHAHDFTEIAPDALAAQLRHLGFKGVTGKADTIAKRPAKIIGAVRG